MEIANDNGEESGDKDLSEDEFRKMVVAMFNQYMEDEEVNPILKLEKEACDLERQMEEVKEEIATYEKTFEVMCKHQEHFLQKYGYLPKQPTRTVGVNVNIVNNDNKIGADVKNVPKVVANTSQVAVSQKPTTQVVQKTIKTEPVVTSATVTQSTNKPIAAGRNSVAFVDLTLEDEKARPNQIKVPPPKAPSKLQGALSSDPPKPVYKPRQEMVSVSPKFTPTTFVPTTLSQVVRMAPGSTQVVTLPSTSTFSTSFVSSPKGVAPHLLSGQRITYLVSTNSPLNVIPPGARAISPQGMTATRLPITGCAVINSSRPIGPSKNAIILTPAPPGTVLPRANEMQNKRAIAPAARFRHPAPLPEQPKYSIQSRQVLLDVPPKPTLKISKPPSGIVLSWNLPLTAKHAQIKTYQLYGYEETSGPADSSMWKKVGEVKALPLPMACTLTQFADGRRYHFAIRAVDVNSRIGPFSDIANICLPPSSEST